jgi:adenosylhomocysteine nucleosidase
MTPSQPLAIVAAMPQELQALLDHLPDPHLVRLGSREFWCGHLQGTEVVLVLSGIGKVAAAITTTLLITEFKARALLFTGVAGGLGDGVNVGDVVLATELIQHDMDASPLFPRYELPGRGLTRLPSDPAMTAQAQAAASQALSPQALSAGGALADVHLSELGLRAPRIHRGLILSGDRFVSTNEESSALRQAFPEALAVEMEGAAVAQVCHDLALPFAVLRVISDRADHAAHVDFGRFVEEIAQRYTLAMVLAMVHAPEQPA